MHIVIAGAGRVGGRLATDLASAGHDVVVIDNDPEALTDLGKAFDGITIEGEAFDVDVLRGARLADADFFGALTNDDNANLMAAEVAKEVFGLKKVLARLQDPAREKSYRALGIPYVSTTKLISSVVFERIFENDFDIHTGFGGGDVEVVDLVLGDLDTELTVADLEIPDQLRVAAIRRGRKTIVPDSGTRLLSGDLVVAATRHGVLGQIQHLLVVEQ